MRRFCLLLAGCSLIVAGCEQRGPIAPISPPIRPAASATSKPAPKPKQPTEKERYEQIKALYEADSLVFAIEKASAFLAQYPKSQYRERVIKLKRNARSKIPTPDPDIAKAREIAQGLSAYESKLDLESSYITIHGMLINNRDNELRYVVITYRIQDKSGAQIGTAMDTTTNLLVGGKWRFKATGSLTSEDVANYEIADVTAY